MTPPVTCSAAAASWPPRPTAAGCRAGPPGSDLDVGHYLLGHRTGEALSLREEMTRKSQLVDAVGVEIDLRNLADAPLELRRRVLEEGVRIYSGDDAARVDLERDVLGRCHDDKDVFRQMHEVRLRELARRGI